MPYIAQLQKAFCGNQTMKIIVASGSTSVAKQFSKHV